MNRAVLASQVACCAALVAATATAQPARLVRDINTAVVNALPTDPQALRVAGGRLFYSSDDGNGREPWSSDGSAAGTTLLLDVSPGGSSKPSGFVDFAGAVFFTAESNGHGRQVWRTSGTTAGTTRITDIAWTAGPATLVVSGGRLFFSAQDAASGIELWSSDGTAAGTALVRDIRPGTASSFASNLIDLGGTLLFTADDGTHGNELWRSDGTEAGTSMVADLDPGGSSSPRDLTLFGGRVAFDATLPALGRELCISDATSSGTGLLKDVRPGADGGVVGWLTVVGPTLYFSGRASSAIRLWKSDGTPAGTVEVPSTAGTSPSSPEWLEALGSIVYFSAQDAGGKELWRSDGTAAGTFRVADIEPGPLSSQPELLKAVGNRVYFTATQSSFGREVWSSDGTPGGTTLVADVKPGPLSSVDSASFTTQYLLGMGSTAFFVAADSLGRELWRADASGASLVRPRGAWTRGGVRGDVAPLGGRLLFVGTNELGQELWSSDGTTPGTSVVKEICPEPCSDPGGPRLGPVIGGALFFTAYEPAHGNELWRSDGSESGTQLQIDLTAGPDYNSPMALTAAEEDLFFMLPSGTAAGTYRLTAGTGALVKIGDFYLHPSNGGPSGVALGGRLIAGAGPLGSYDSVYRSDGTPAGTVKLAATRWPTSFHLAASQAFFSAITDDHGREVWRSDGTIEGTRLVRDICPGTCSSLPNYELNSSIAVGDVLFFNANDGTHGEEVWLSDGTAAGTRLLKDVNPGPAGSGPYEFALMNGVVYWTADDGSHGRELWRSDGTEGGTFLVKDIMPGRDWGAPYWRIVNAGGRLLFDGYQPATGVELWESDGTAAGTRFLQEFWPGPMGGGGYPLAIAGDDVYLAAATEDTGAELWALPIGPRLSVADAHTVEGDVPGHALSFQVTLDGTSARTTTVTYETRSGSASSGVDFTPVSGSLTFAPGVTSATVSVPVAGDLSPETNETLSLRLTGANADLQDDRGDGLILDDDGPRVSAVGASVVEGDGGTTPLTASAVLLTKDGLPATSAVAVHWETVPGTASAGQDFEPAQGTLTFGAGASSGSSLPLQVQVTGDALDEPDESFSVELRSASSTVDLVARATGAILDDDGAASGPARELSHGNRIDLVSAASGVQDWFVLREGAHASYEVVVEGASGDLLPLELLRLRPDGSQLGEALPLGTGSALSMRWFGFAPMPDDGVKLRVRDEGCAPSCPGGFYRVRAFETTLSVPRILNTSTARTALILFNSGDRSLYAKLTCWSQEGLVVASPSGSVLLGPRQSSVLDTSLICPTAATATIAHDGTYGSLVGKAVTFDSSTGSSFDTPMTYRPR